mmetsp:Transcript_24299/g.56158  ORF Transcript_24299/g.56158 Transcript_24299/m.56158 type:complete len:287 (+) Transcript_24299:6339-7199(+)
MRLDSEGVHDPGRGQREGSAPHSGAVGARGRSVHLVGGEGGAADFAGLEEVARRDDALGLAGRTVDAALPTEHRLGGGARVLFVLHLDVVIVGVGEAYGGREGCSRQVVVRLPPINDEAVVHPQLDPLVRLGNASLKREHVGRLRVRLMVLVVEYLEETRPANRKALPVRQRQGAEVPGDVCAEAALGVLDVKVDAVLGASCHGHAELHVIVIGGVEPRSLREGGVDLVVALYRGEVGHLVAAAEGEEARRGHDGGRAERLDSLGEGGAGARVDGVGLLGAVDCVA